MKIFNSNNIKTSAQQYIVNDAYAVTHIIYIKIHAKNNIKSLILYACRRL